VGPPSVVSLGVRGEWRRGGGPGPWSLSAGVGPRRCDGFPRLWAGRVFRPLPRTLPMDLCGHPNQPSQPASGRRRLLVAQIGSLIWRRSVPAPTDAMRANPSLRPALQVHFVRRRAKIRELETMEFPRQQIAQWPLRRTPAGQIAGSIPVGRNGDPKGLGRSDAAHGERALSALPCLLRSPGRTNRSVHREKKLSSIHESAPASPCVSSPKRAHMPPPGSSRRPKCIAINVGVALDDERPDALWRYRVWQAR